MSGTAVRRTLVVLLVATATVAAGYAALAGTSGSPGPHRPARPARPVPASGRRSGYAAPHDGGRRRPHPAQPRRRRADELHGPRPRDEACHAVAGDESYILKVRVASPGELETLLQEIRTAASVATRTTVVLSTPYEGRPPAI